MTKPLTVVLLVLASLVPAGRASSQAGTGVVRVAPTGSDSPGCGSVASPCASLQYAVDQFPIPGAGTILVAAGTYSSSDPNRIVRITRRDITMQGGFTAAFTSADPVANRVVVDGGLARRGFLVDCPIGSADSCRLALSGVTITRGSAPPDPGLRDAFGGALDAYRATIELTDVIVVDNEARGIGASNGVPGSGSGGGLSFRSSTASLTRVAIEDNRAVGGDGTATAFRGGLAVGGGIFSYESTIALRDVVARRNSAIAGDAPASSGFTEGAQRSDGLGGFWALIFGSATVESLEATENSAKGGVVNAAGGLGLGGAIFFQFVTSASIQRSFLYDNVALGGAGNSNLGGGGGLFAEDAVVTIEASEIVSNRAEGAIASAFGGTGGGGGIYMNSVAAQNTSLNVTNGIIGGNAAVAGGGSPAGYAFGGGVFLQCPQSSCSSAPAMHNSASLLHATLAANSVTGGSYNQGSALYSSRFTEIDSSFGIISGHTTVAAPGFYAGEAVLALGETRFTGTLWHDNTTKSFTALGGTFSDVAPLAGPPEFVSPNGSPPDFRIQETSAARDAAIGSTLSTDVDGEARPAPANGIADVGADEYVVPEPMGGAAMALLGLAALGRRRGARSV